MIKKLLLILSSLCAFSSIGFSQSQDVSGRCFLSPVNPICKFAPMKQSYIYTDMITLLNPGRKSGVCGFILQTPTAESDIGKVADNVIFAFANDVNAYMVNKNTIYFTRPNLNDNGRIRLRVTSNRGTMSLSDAIKSAIGKDYLYARIIQCPAGS